jgi:oligopeptide transport system substrate-binding protein
MLPAPAAAPCRRRRPGRRAGGRVRRLSAGVALALVLSLAGCTLGGRGDGHGASGGSGGGAAPQGRRGGTLAIALLDPGPLDPARADGLADEVVLGNLFDGLTAIDPAGAVRPAVAASWTSDPALRRWTFHLRADARWSDGSPVRSGDFTFAWRRLADPRTRPAPTPVARTLLAGVTGYRSFAAGKARSIAGLQAPDPATLVVELDHPMADLPALVAAVALSPLPEALVGPDPAAYLARPVGDGPFRLAAPPRPGRSLTFDRNPAYGAAPALLDKVSVHLDPDPQTAWLELQDGQVAFGPVPPDQLAAARTVYGPSADGRTRPGLLQAPTLATWQLTVNLRSKPATDPRWRQAVSLAIDRDRLAAALAGSPATTLVPPATPGPGTAGGPASTGPAPACPACAHDPSKARSLLAKVDHGRGPLTLAVPPGPQAARVATLVAADLAAAGAKVTRSPAPAGGSPLTLVRRVAPYPRPDPYLSGTTVGPAARHLLDQARATPDPPTRATRYQQAETAILADLPAIPLLTESSAAVLAPTPPLQGFTLTPWNTLDLATISLPA